MLRFIALSVSSLACTVAPLQGAPLQGAQLQDDAVTEPTAISLEEIMADPLWMGRFPSSPYWSLDSKTVFYFRKNPEDDLNDLHSIHVETKRERLYQEWIRSSAHSPGGVYDFEAKWTNATSIQFYLEVDGAIDGSKIVIRSNACQVVGMGDGDREGTLTSSLTLRCTKVAAAGDEELEIFVL